MSISSVLKKGIRYIKRKEQVPITNLIDYQKVLEGHIALITGGNSGIGFEIAKKFIESGCRVILAGRNEGKLKKCTDLLGDNAKYVVLDVSRIQDIGKVAPLLNTFFSGYVDILVNSAGVGASNDFWEVTENEFDSIIDTNTKGTFFMSQAISKIMVENNIKGHILNISSSSAQRPAWTPYEISKWAVNGFTKGLADTLLPYGIVVNAIAPGPTITPMIGKNLNDNLYSERSPSKRFILPSEVANLAVFMVSSAADMIVGDTVYLSGGSGVITLHN